ncbi:MAG: Crp/Fnr family transcriptional regulator [Halieaceae bacterium]|jgi:CRP-like cAMP-binding protein|nr:Crp/Fnr family transcriptional regulator [Halieaceae bacterium]
MKRDQLREFIAESSWFAGAPDDVLDALTNAAAVRQYATGAFVWTTGQKTSEVFALVSGRLRISMASEMGQEFALIDWEPGAWLGEQVLAIDAPNMLEVRVLAPSDLLVLPAQVVRDAGEVWPTLYRNLYRADWVNTRGLYEILSALLFYPLKARVAGRVLALTADHGQRVEDGVLLDIKLSQNDFARLAMGSRQRVNGIFRDWDKQGLVESRGEYLLIKDVAGLQREMIPFE